MARRIDWVEDLLQRWASAVTVGDGSGYPVKSILHPTWSPPTPGLTPTLKAAPAQRDARRVHRALVQLSEHRPKLAATVVGVYVLKRPAAEVALMVDGCQESTVYSRVCEAHAWLAAVLGATEKDRVAAGLTAGQKGD